MKVKKTRAVKLGKKCKHNDKVHNFIIIIIILNIRNPSMFKLMVLCRIVLMLELLPTFRADGQMAIYHSSFIVQNKILKNNNKSCALYSKFSEAIW